MSALSGIAITVLRPAGDALALGVRAERRVRSAVSRSAGETAVGLVDAMLTSPAAEEAVDRILDSPLLERALARAIGGPLVEAVVRDLSEYEVVGRVIESRLLDEAVARLLESKYLWLLVDEVARSPSVTAAISHQGVGFAEQMAGAVRDRSQVADARMERRARRLFRRETADGHE